VSLTQPYNKKARQTSEGMDVSQRRKAGFTVITSESPLDAAKIKAQEKIKTLLE
jgi:hypothetical protein